MRRTDWFPGGVNGAVTVAQLRKVWGLGRMTALVPPAPAVLTIVGAGTGRVQERGVGTGRVQERGAGTGRAWERGAGTGCARERGAGGKHTLLQGEGLVLQGCSGPSTVPAAPQLFIRLQRPSHEAVL